MLSEVGRNLWKYPPALRNLAADAVELHLLGLLAPHGRELAQVLLASLRRSTANPSIANYGKVLNFAMDRDVRGCSDARVRLVLTKFRPVSSSFDLLDQLPPCSSESLGWGLDL